MRTKKWVVNLLLAIAVCMLTSALGLTIYYHWQDMRAGADADELTHQVEAVIDLARETGQHKAAPAAAAEHKNDLNITQTSDETSHTSEDHLSDTETEDTITSRENIAGLDGAIGLLEFPQIGRVLPVMGSYDEQLLSRYPCQYASDECGEDQMIIAGHNYSSHFRCIREFEAGDEIRFTALDGTVFTYEVTKREEISGNDRQALLAGDWDLTLFTCAIDRRNRILIRCNTKEKGVKIYEQEKRH